MISLGAVLFSFRLQCPNFQANSPLSHELQDSPFDVARDVFAADIVRTIKSSVNLTTRLLSRFILDLVVSGAAIVDGDVDAGLLLLAISHVNIEAIPGEDLKRARYDQAQIPDSLKRPISAHALAASLPLPRETVRRQVKTLIAIGGCARVGQKGLIVPASFYRRPEMLNMQAEMLLSLLTLMGRLDALGIKWPDAVDPIEADAVGAAGSAELIAHLPPVLVTRLVIAFALRAFSTWTPGLGGLPMRMLVMAIHEANIAHLDAKTSLRYAALDAAIPDNLRKPIPLSVLADRLPMSRSTTYRLAKKLSAEGGVKRVGAGLIVTRDWLSTEPQQSLRAQMHKDFLKLLSQLSALAIAEADRH